MSLSKAAGAAASIDKMPNTSFFTITSKFGHEICSNREQVELHIHPPLVLLKEAVQNNFPFSLSLSLFRFPHTYTIVCLYLFVCIWQLHCLCMALHTLIYNLIRQVLWHVTTAEYSRQPLYSILAKPNCQEDYECLSKPTCIIWTSLPDGSSSLIRL